MKLHETRSWATRHRGTIAIHASASKNQQDRDSYVLLKGLIYEKLPDVQDDDFYRNAPKFEALPRGAIIGIIELVDCLLCTSDPERVISINTFDEMTGNFTPGRYAWRMARPVLFAKPIPCRGALGLWQVPNEVMAQVVLEHGLIKLK